MRPLIGLVLLAATASCSSSAASGNDVARAPAGVILGLTTDLAVPAAMDTLTVQVDVGTSTVLFQTYALPTEAMLPGTLVLQASQAAELAPGSINPGIAEVTQAGAMFTVTVTGKLASASVVVRTATLTMPSGVKRLDMPLEAACAGIVCEAAQSCQAGVCKTSAVDSSALPGG